MKSDDVFVEAEVSVPGTGVMLTIHWCDRHQQAFNGHNGEWPKHLLAEHAILIEEEPSG